MELEAGTINCIWNGFTIDEERLAAYEFTDPYMNNNQIVVVMEDSTINSFADMAGKNVAVQDGSSAIKALEKNTELEASLAEVVKTPDNMTALQDLKSGAVDAVVMDECVARYNIEKQGEGFRVLDEVVGQETFGVGFKKGNTELRDKVENALIEMAQDGTMARISTEWFGKDITTIGK